MPKKFLKEKEAPAKEPMSFEDAKFEMGMLISELDKDIKRYERDMAKEVETAVEKRMKNQSYANEAANIALCKKHIELIRKQRNGIKVNLERRELFETERAMIQKMSSFSQMIAKVADTNKSFDSNQTKDFIKMAKMFESQTRSMDSIIESMNSALNNSVDEDYVSQATGDIETAVGEILNKAEVSEGVSKEELTKMVLEELKV